MRRRGEYSARLKSVRLTRESESTLWRTPAADQGGTPKALLEGKITRPSGHKIQIRLQDQVKMWPTPTTQDNNQIKGKDKRGTTLGGAVRNWPTPSARDHKGGYIGGRIRNGKVSFDTLDVAVQHLSNKDKKSGTLNPDWVEWLMGVPTGWTDLGSWATE
tara:strand:+ start:439 stop:918 length:480 start_codon:yes stop_codon:yes gene_type:complete